MMRGKMEAKIISIPDGKICDYIDGKFRNDTPEEYVRQTVEKRLVNEHKYLSSQIKIEFPLALGTLRPRADIVIFDKDAENQTQDHVKIIIECKAENVDIRNAKEKDGLDQLKSYMEICPNCEWGMWTNGRQKEVLKKYKNAKGKYAYMEYNDIPSADGNLEDIDCPKRTTLKNASDDNLLFVFKTCHNHIYANDGLHKDAAFFELLKVIFCKIEDERNIPKSLEFFSESMERSNPDGQLTVQKRIFKIFERVKKKYGKIFDSNDEIKLTPRSLAYVVSELQKYSLLNTNIDIKGKAYEEIVGANLRGDRGEFFTPRNIMKMVVEMIDPKINERVLDSSCGTGGFLVNAMTYVLEQLEKQFSEQMGCPKPQWDNDSLKTFQDKVTEMAKTCYFGFDINPDLVKATKMNMVMNNDGSGNILQINSLLPPHEWTEEFKSKLLEALKSGEDSNSYKIEIRNHTTIGFFDVIVTNPPFGSKIPIRDKTILEQYDLAHKWMYNKDKETWIKTESFQSFVPPEILFIERCIQFLKEGGRLGIVLPDSILGAPGLCYIREWLIMNTRIVASLDLHTDTFQPHNGTQTSVLILQKKTKEEKYQEAKSGTMDYNIFMAMVEKIGHDKRGNTLYKRDKEGNEILVPDADNISVLGSTADGNRTVSHEKKKKLEDDQTPLVPKIFKEWKFREGNIQSW
jgi:type I restriction enzyme M protein